MAGDTPTAQAVAGHLAGCRACTRGARPPAARRPSDHSRRRCREMPPPDLKSRTLAAVRAEGDRVARPDAAAGGRGCGVRSRAASPSTAPPTPNALRRPRADPLRPGADGRRARPRLGRRHRRRRRPVGRRRRSLIVGSRVDDQLAAQAETISALEEVTTATLAVTAEPDAEHVALDRRPPTRASPAAWPSRRRRPSWWSWPMA